ncbi:MAG: 4'-phosphopantetheinyl transferase superfamily protein [Clostridiales Family XIII bacterium]|jgi:4'-phosphopantetheinyl transferase|nr:4'-phosphopantetheinyl transferase superfamily protein [Clostridiales Family XIII bacterium]
MILYVRRTGIDPGAAEAPRGNAALMESKGALFREVLFDYAEEQGILVPKKPEAFRYAYGAHGKPFFDTPPLSSVRFSISHSGQCWAAIFHTAAVGLDIEDVSATGRHSGYDRARFERIAARFFSPDERSHLRDAADASAAKERFFKIWTRKEAYMKYTGNGFSEAPERFSVIAPMAEGRRDGADADARGKAVRRKRTPGARGREGRDDAAFRVDVAADRGARVFDANGDAIPGVRVFDLFLETGLRCACCRNAGTAGP